MSSNPRSINSQPVNAQEAYNRQQYRSQDVTKDKVEPQSGPVANRARAAGRKTETNSKDQP